MIGANSKLSFFNNEYSIGHLSKVSSDFSTYFKISQIQAYKRKYFILELQVNCRKICAVNQQWPKLSFIIKTSSFAVCEKFQMISMQYDDFLNEDS